MFENSKIDTFNENWKMKIENYLRYGKKNKNNS